MRLKDAVGVFLVIMSVLVGPQLAYAMCAPAGDAAQSAHHHDQDHASTHAAESHTDPASRCHDGAAGERCCAHMMTCCVALATATQSSPDTNQGASAALIANNRSSYVTVPKLPPRIG